MNWMLSLANRICIWWGNRLINWLIIEFNLNFDTKLFNTTYQSNSSLFAHFYSWKIKWFNASKKFGRLPFARLDFKAFLHFVSQNFDLLLTDIHLLCRIVINELSPTSFCAALTLGSNFFVGRGWLWVEDFVDRLLGLWGEEDFG